jgi:hypothetical protein
MRCKFLASTVKSHIRVTSTPYGPISGRKFSARQDVPIKYNHRRSIHGHFQAKMLENAHE